MLTVGGIEVGQRFRADVVWMDERPLDPGRVYLLKHSTRTVTAEFDHGLVLNQIGSVNVSVARPIMFDRYLDNRGTGSFIIIDPATNFTSGAGMIAEGLRGRASGAAQPSAAERLARLARTAPSDAEAVEAVRKALEELLA
jgi:sulfate adenylyltransferase subunit 1 (EFTu-like GTPase family)